jgi:hypothetical protein
VAQPWRFLARLGKDIVRTTIAIVETRSGKKVTYQDDEARKSGVGH